MKNITPENAKELALITAIIISEDILKGTAIQVFDEAYKIAEEFIMIHPASKDWENEELDFDETIKVFTHVYRIHKT